MLRSAAPQYAAVRIEADELLVLLPHAIQMSAVEDRRVLRGAEYGRPQFVQRFGHGLVLIPLQLEHHRPGVVSAGEENLSLGQDYRRGHGGDADFPVGRVPEDRAVVGRNARHAAFAAINEHPLAGELHWHDRRMGHGPAARVGAFPEHPAGSAVERHQQRIAAGGKHRPVAVDQAGTVRHTTAAPWRRTAAPGRSASRVCRWSDRDTRPGTLVPGPPDTYRSRRARSATCRGSASHPPDS